MIETSIRPDTGPFPWIMIPPTLVESKNVENINAENKSGTYVER